MFSHYLYDISSKTWTKQKKKTFFRKLSIFTLSLSLSLSLSFNPCGEFRWSPEGPVSQIHSRSLQAGAPGIFSDLSRFLRKATRSYRTYSSLVKLQPWFLSLRWKTCLWAELRPWCLNLQESPALGQNILMKIYNLYLVLPMILISLTFCISCILSQFIVVIVA